MLHKNQALHFPKWHLSTGDQNDILGIIEATLVPFFLFFPVFLPSLQKTKSYYVYFRNFEPFLSKESWKTSCKTPSIHFYLYCHGHGTEGGCACVLVLGVPDSRRGHGPWARRQSNATCVPPKPLSPCHPGLFLQLSLLGRKKNWEKKYRKGKKLLALTCNWQVNIWQTSSRE